MATEQIYTEDFDVQRYVWDVDTRPCKYTLALGDVAFADFDADRNGRLLLVRISLDGYGCCTPDRGRMNPMGAQDSSVLIRMIEGGGPLATQDVRTILRRYFEAHRRVIWEDALVEWGLVAAPERKG